MKNINKGLIVSCQALEDEPLHSSFIMGRMAKAAVQGGAVGIRANSNQDILEIKRNVDVPIIGIVKRDYENSDIYITPTMTEIDELIEVGVDIIALDATDRLRPGNITLKEFIDKIREKYGNVLLMADCSTYDEAIYADKIGFDFIGTTLVGYTVQSKGIHIDTNDFELIRNIINSVSKPVIAEGNIDTPEKAKRVLELGCYSVVVGSIITRPKVITEKFINEIKKIGE
ncbi:MULTISPECIES: N-acetylmannosamine-6-phosphate 2-epimerase [Clostridium]|jgi:N-acylglucosamine-6-phosphate 2-epimerase|uniref:N-acylglucosamine-6-phosphate 2-epimerase n=2 Tax=root TaxID=1 RepID=A0A644XNU1_9ZZZZ|nr:MULTISPECIES: N-acetylmannosamine-6-phosphate 2-epimerase [Clostridium]EOR24439.1 Putative N-acetylmannosamine-6-phosphate epimerase [Clostridium sartagoforme AAU1]KLE14747.1 N-acetylmannosamine-6-phosphate 2-epimerase [Clostridium sp. C8]